MEEMKDRVKKEDLTIAIGKFVLRIEKQQEEVEKLNYFVRIIDFGALSSSNTQIVYGRNGTGKSHLFKAFYEYCESNFEHNKVLPIYVDCRNLHLGNDFKDININQLILRFYRYFIRKIIDELKAFSTKVITPSLSSNIYLGESGERKKKIDESIDKLYSIISLGTIEESINEYSRKVESQKVDSKSIGGKIGGSGRLSTLASEAKLEGEFGLAGEWTRAIKQDIQLIYNGLAVIEYDRVRNGLENIIKQSGAKAIILLIDEWSSVNFDIQPYLAEMINKTLGHSDKIFFKLATIKYFTKTSTKVDSQQWIGFQLGVDIHILADLDDLLNYDIDKQGVKDFLTSVAYKHTCLELPEISDYTVREFENYITNELFEDPSVYFELIRASEGNPRDFLSIFSSCCSGGKLVREKKISQKQVIEHAIKYFTETKSHTISFGYKAANDLFNQIFDKVVKNGQKLFFVSAKNGDNRLLKDLWHYRFIHLVSPSYIVVDENRTPHEYIVYSMDYGKLISLKAHKTGQNIVNAMIESLDTTISEIIPEARDSLSQVITELGGEPLKELGKTAAADKGVEIADMTNIKQLETYLVDDILSNN